MVAAAATRSSSQSDEMMITQPKNRNRHRIRPGGSYVGIVGTVYHMNCISPYERGGSIGHTTTTTTMFSLYSSAHAALHTLRFTRCARCAVGHASVVAAGGVSRWRLASCVARRRRPQHTAPTHVPQPTPRISALLLRTSIRGYWRRHDPLTLRLLVGPDESVVCEDVHSS